MKAPIPSLLARKCKDSGIFGPGLLCALQMLAIGLKYSLFIWGEFLRITTVKAYILQLTFGKYYSFYNNNYINMENAHALLSALREKSSFKIVSRTTDGFMLLLNLTNKDM